MLYTIDTIALTDILARALRRASARARDLLNLNFEPRPKIILRRERLQTDLNRKKINRAADLIGDSKTSKLVNLVQVNRIRGRLSVAQSYIAAAQLAHTMISASSEQQVSASGDASASASGSSIPSPTSSFDTYLPMITSALDRLTTSANALPSTRSDINFNRTMDRKFANDLDEASDRVLRMAETLLMMVEVGQEELKGKGKGKEEAAKSTKTGVKASTKTRRKLEDEDDVVDGYKRGVIGVVDGLLEDAVSCPRHRIPEEYR